MYAKKFINLCRAFAFLTCILNKNLHHRSMITIAEILVFSSPFEKMEQIYPKIRKLESSLSDFCTSILGVEDNEFEWRRDGHAKVAIPNYVLEYELKN